MHFVWDSKKMLNITSKNTKFLSKKLLRSFTIHSLKPLTIQITEDSETIRIISARKATKKEQKDFEEL